MVKVITDTSAIMYKLHVGGKGVVKVITATSAVMYVCTCTGGRLVMNKLLVEGKDFVLLPEVIWKVFVSWYCSTAYNSIPTLPRTVRCHGNHAPSLA